jgi:hypothetical protein
MSTSGKPLGPNRKALIMMRVGMIAVPKGGGLESAIQFLTTPGRISTGFREAVQFVDGAIQKIRNAGEPNPYKASTDEEICGALLSKIQLRSSSHPGTDPGVSNMETETRRRQ